MGQAATGAVLQGCWGGGVFPLQQVKLCWGHGASPAVLLRRKNGTAPAPYNRLPPEAVFANTLGLLIVLFGVLVLCALAKPDWKRPEDGSTDTRQVPAALRGCASAPRAALRSRGGGLPPPTTPVSPSPGWAGQGSAGSRLTHVSLQPLLGTER